MNDIEKIKKDLTDEIRSLYMNDENGFLERRVNWLYKIFKRTKENALSDVMGDVFLDRGAETVDELVVTSSNIAVLLEIKYKLINFGSFLAPIWKFIFPFLLSFGAILLTINSIRDLNVRRLFGINWPTFIIILIIIIAAAILASVFILKTRHKRMFAVYIKERLDYIIQCKMSGSCE